MAEEIKKEEKELKDQMLDDIEALKKQRADWTQQLELAQMNLHRLNGAIAYIQSKTK